MSRGGIAELIVSLEPEMRELISLRAEIIALRTKASPPTPVVSDLLAKTGIRVFRGPDGRWEARIDLVNPDTGSPVIGSGAGPFETDVEAFVFAVNHLAGLLAREWTREDDDGR